MARYDARGALIVVDMQNDFVSPRGSLSVPGGASIIELANIEIALAQAGGALVVYTQDWHPPVTPHFRKDGGTWPVHCVQGTWGAQLHPAITLVGPVIRKGENGEDGYSGFTMRDPYLDRLVPTGLGPLLESSDIERVTIIGLATDYCVKATALDAHARGLRTHVIEDVIRAVDLAPGDGARAIEEMRAAGIVVARGDDIALLDDYTPAL